MLSHRLAPLLLNLIAASGLACSPATSELRIPPAPIRGRWPDPAFEPSRQCHGDHALPGLENLLPRARLASWIPGIQAVELDSGRRCIIVTVEDTETGRMAELLLRGVAVPRRAVLLRLDAPG
jgi:hypothetical protein